MKRLSNLIAILITIILTTYASWSMYWFYKQSNFTQSVANVSWIVRDLQNTDTAFGGIFHNPSIDNSLPYNKYKIIQDSVERIKKQIEHINSSRFGYGISNSFFGIKRIDDKFSERAHKRFQNTENFSKEQKTLDSLYNLVRLKTNIANTDTLHEMIDAEQYKIREKNNEQLRNEEKKYQDSGTNYITLPNYSFNYRSIKDFEKDYKFYISKGTYNIVYKVCDSVMQSKYDTISFMHYESKQILVRFSEQDSKVLIPITLTQFNLLSKVIWGGKFLIIFLNIYFFIGLPAQVVYNISKSKAFISKNISIINTVALALLFYTLIKVITPYILHWFFRNKIPSEIMLNIYSNFQDNFEVLQNILISLALFLIAQAFKRGYKLQQEQDLTI